MNVSLGPTPAVDRLHLGREALLALASAVVLIAAATVLFATRPGPFPAGSAVTIGPGLEPRMSPAEVTVVANEAMAMMAAQVSRPTEGTIERLSAVKFSDVTSVEPNAGAETGERGDAIVWVVRATGTFSTYRGRQIGPLIRDSGYLIIDDATGMVVSMGMP